MSEETVYTVAELTRRIKTVIESALGPVWLQGELSNVRRPASGHFYFTIKDASAQIAAVLFRGQQRGMRCTPRDGLLVKVFGEITVYERGGNYQVLVRRMQEAGQGALQARFEALKKALEAEGLFDPARKRPIPVLPRRLGIVTSPTGAAIRDILNVLTRRFPNLHVVLAPARVQGDGAAEEIAAAIDALNALGGMDVLVVGRGGGSIEDLWAFNAECVARAIARSRVPVISAVGHEIDFTIADFVADLRAPTPSAAAELVVGRKDAFEERVAELQGRLLRGCRERVARGRWLLDPPPGSYVFREPGHAVRRLRDRLRACEQAMGAVSRGRVRDTRQRLDEAGVRMLHGVALRVQARKQDHARLTAQLKALSPLGVLARGYSVTQRPDGRIVRNADTLQDGDRVRTRVAKGEFESEVRRHG
jgi:exodeoxyribonuclease VII large subunit